MKLAILVVLLGFSIQTHACGNSKTKKFEAIVAKEERSGLCDWYEISVPSTIGDWSVGAGNFRIGEAELKELALGVISYNQDDLEEGDELLKHPGHTTFSICLSKEYIEKAKFSVTYYHGLCAMPISIDLNAHNK